MDKFYDIKHNINLSNENIALLTTTWINKPEMEKENPEIDASPYRTSVYDKKGISNHCSKVRFFHEGA